MIFCIKKLSSEWYESNRLLQAHRCFILFWELANNQSVLSCMKKPSKSYGLDIQTADQLQQVTPVTGMSLPVMLRSFKLGILHREA